MGKKYYGITSIKTEVVLSLNKIEAPCGTKVGVNQIFQLKFLSNNKASKDI